MLINYNYIFIRSDNTYYDVHSRIRDDNLYLPDNAFKYNKRVKQFITIQNYTFIIITIILYFKLGECIFHQNEYGIRKRDNKLYIKWELLSASYNTNILVLFCRLLDYAFIYNESYPKSGLPFISNIRLKKAYNEIIDQCNCKKYGY